MGAIPGPRRATARRLPCPRAPPWPNSRWTTRPWAPSRWPTPSPRCAPTAWTPRAACRVRARARRAAQQAWSVRCGAPVPAQHAADVALRPALTCPALPPPSTSSLMRRRLWPAAPAQPGHHHAGHHLLLLPLPQPRAQGPGAPLPSAGSAHARAALLGEAGAVELGRPALRWLGSAAQRPCACASHPHSSPRACLHACLPAGAAAVLLWRRCPPCLLPSSFCPASQLTPLLLYRPPAPQVLLLSYFGGAQNRAVATTSEDDLVAQVGADGC